MPNTQTDQLAEAVDFLQQSADEALANGSQDDFARFESQLSRFEAGLREIQQEMWATEAEQAIEHLERGDGLTETDVDVIRAFLVSDAEHYLAVENNFADWTSELHRLFEDMKQRVSGLDRDGIADLRGVVKDAVRLVPDIRNYLAEQERVNRFETALHTVDQQSRTMLAQVLRQQLRSDQR